MLLNLLKQSSKRLLRAPSSRGINPWEFILVDDPAIMRQLSDAKQHGAEFLKNAPLGIVVCADTQNQMSGLRTAR